MLQGIPKIQFREQFMPPPKGEIARKKKYEPEKRAQPQCIEHRDCGKLQQGENSGKDQTGKEQIYCGQSKLLEIAAKHLENSFLWT
jgi:hypothetical protein